MTFVFCLMLAAISHAAVAADKNFDKNEFAARRAKLLEQMPDGIAVIPAGDAHIHAVKFRQSPDFFYLTGIEEPGAVLVLVGPRKMSVVFAHKRPAWKINVEGAGILDIEKPADAYALTQVQNIQSLIPFFNVMSKEAKRLYVPLTSPDSLQMARHEMQQHETERTTHPLYRYTPPLKQAIARLHELQPHLMLSDINPLMDNLRWIKSSYEIQRMRESGRIGAEGVKVAMRGTKPGMFEYELEAAARFVYTKLGARGDAFMPIVASGPNTITWHYSENSRRMEAGDVVLMDYGTDYDYYTSDITRTWPVSGTFTPEQEKMYRCILEARNAVIAAMKPGVTVANLQDVAEVVYKKHGFHQQFLNLGRYVGHHVGLSVHDVEPTEDGQPFKPGVVFNVEPLLEFRDKKIHTRLEDTVLITENGAENLTAGVPAELDAVYALIKEKGLSLN
ncbi:MAG TPA: Xaa-Pro peptidase family protein [Pyrinomonadaceae bacterium]|jgi:Xaa-Pro aminopeptidase